LGTLSLRPHELEEVTSEFLSALPEKTTPNQRLFLLIQILERTLPTIPELAERRVEQLKKVSAQGMAILKEEIESALEKEGIGGGKLLKSQAEFLFVTYFL